MVSHSKAITYLHALDDARCASNWAHVPEAARKVLKRDQSSIAKVANLEAETRRCIGSGLLQKPSAQDQEKLSKIKQDLGEGLNGDSQEENNYIHTVAYAHVLLLLGKYESVVQTLESVKDIDQQSRTWRYTAAVTVKKRVILADALEKLQEFEKAVSVYDGSSSSSANNTTDSNRSPEELEWTELLYRKYCDLTNEKFPDKRAAALKGYNSVVKAGNGNNSNYKSSPVTREQAGGKLDTLWSNLLYYSKELENDETGSNEQLEKEVQNASEVYEKLLFESSTFPHATKQNDRVTDYLEVLVQNWSRMKSIGRDYTLKVLATLRHAVTLTFHSCTVMRQQVIILSALEEYKEALLAFSVYRSYQERSKLRSAASPNEKGENKGDTDRNATMTATRALEIVVNVTKDPEAALDYANLLVQWAFSDSAIANGDGSIGVSVAARAHAAVASAYIFVAEDQHTEEKYQKYELLGLRHYKESLAHSPNVSSVHNAYAIQLARTGLISEALESVRSALMHDQTNLQAWHLMALLLSVQEEYETAIKVINSALGMAVDGDNEAQSKAEGTRDFQQNRKRAIIQLKMTQVALIEATAGSDVALEKIPDVLHLYSEFFPNVNPTASGGEAVEDEEQHLMPVKSKRSIFKSSRSVLNGGGGGSISAKHRKKAHVAKTPVKHAKFLKQIWLWISGVYRRAGLYKEAEQAIIEAESLNGATPETHVELGLLIAQERPVHAMEEFEAALDENRDHLPAVLGLANLILDHAVYSATASSNATKEERHTLFISEKDEYAANARILGLLETLSQRTPGRRVSECFWMLSQFYEKTKRDHEAQHALWRSVALEEARPVRDYACIL